MNAHDPFIVAAPADQPIDKLAACATPAFLMNAPFSLNFDHPNNATMQSLSTEERRLDLDKALSQFHDLYSCIAGHGIVYLLPSCGGLPDQTYVSNVAAFLPHRSDQTVILSRFRSLPRRGEDAAARPLLESMGYTVIPAPYFFEGEADLKFLHGNIYVGACGMRTSEDALCWMSERFGMTVLPVTIHDPRAYHLDCVVFPIDAEHTLVCRDLVQTDQFKAIEAMTSVIDVDYGAAMAMATNCLRVGQNLLAQTNISLYVSGDTAYSEELAKIRLLEDVSVRLGLELTLFDLSEFRKSGAALSCFVGKLNRAAFSSQLSIDAVAGRRSSDAWT